MKTLWNDTRQIEKHLTGRHTPGEALLFEAKLLLEPTINDTIQLQQKTYNAICDYGRRELKKEIESVHEQLFNSPRHSNFSQKIKQLFKNL